MSTYEVWYFVNFALVGIRLLFSSFNIIFDALWGFVALPNVLTKCSPTDQMGDL